MEFRELEAFVAVAEELHFGRAAARLHLSQPALSQQIQRLEADLGATLLQRSSRAVSLSPAGTIFLDRCRALLGDVADAVDCARRVADGRSGLLSIGYVGSALYGLLPDVVARLRRLHPAIELTLTERKTAPQLALLLDGQQDVAIIHRPEQPPPDLAIRDIETNDVVVALPPGHPESGQEAPLAWAALARTPFVLFPEEIEPDTHALLLSQAAAHGLSLRVAQEATGLPTILGLVAAGVGAAFVVDSVAEYTPHPGLSFRRLIDPPTITTSVAWDPATPNPAVATFMRTFNPAFQPHLGKSQTAEQP